MRASALVAAGAFVVLAMAGCQGQDRSPAAGQAVDAAERRPFDHTLFDRILQAYVRQGMVDYAALKTQQGAALEEYLDALAGAAPDGFANADDELAFWLNAYNAFVIAGVLERYPEIEKVTEVPDFFEEERWEAAGQILSLDGIENDIIRPRFGDPRIHFVLVCAAQSCPPLQDQAMRAETVQSQLEAATRDAVNGPKYVRVDPDKKVLHLTRIMSWYRKDFVQTHGSLEAFVLACLEEPARQELAGQTYETAFMGYDWNLNDAGRAGATPPAR